MQCRHGPNWAAPQSNLPGVSTGAPRSVRYREARWSSCNSSIRRMIASSAAGTGLGSAEPQQFLPAAPAANRGSGRSSLSAQQAGLAEHTGQKINLRCASLPTAPDPNSPVKPSIACAFQAVIWFGCTSYSCGQRLLSVDGGRCHLALEGRRRSGVLVLSCLLLIRGTLAALRQKLHLSHCPNVASHLCQPPLSVWTVEAIHDGGGNPRYGGPCLELQPR